MPSRSHSRQHDTQAGPLAWFSTEAGQGLLAVQEPAMERVLASCPAAAWLWLGVAGAAAPQVPGGRGVMLRRSGDEFLGAVHCQLPLPFASESFGAVLIQHALDDGFAIAGVIDECARILAPGGTLWLAALNPWSPYRARWSRTGLHARDPGGWQSALRRAGFAVDTVSLQWLGPHWRVAHGDVGVGASDRLRAGIALTVNKRVHSLIPPTPLRNLRWETGFSGRMRRRPVIMP